MKHENVTYLPQETYFTAVLQLGDMFGGGGVPIDHYIIQADNDTELETTGPTYYISKLPYHTTLLVNISAHNCAGYSDPIMFEVHQDQGINFLHIFIPIPLVLCAVYGMGCDIPTSPVVTVAVSVTVAIVSTITVILGLVALCKLFQWHSKSSKWKQRVLLCIIMYISPYRQRW